MIQALGATSAADLTTRGATNVGDQDAWKLVARRFSETGKYFEETWAYAVGALGVMVKTRVFTEAASTNNQALAEALCYVPGAALALFQGKWIITQPD